MSVQTDLQKLANKKRAALLARYFKTGKGEYGQGDVFIGLTVPQVREVAKKYKDIALSDIETLLHDKIHEYRLAALFILIEQFKKADELTKKKLYDFYLAHTKWINNWDLVDLSAKYIVGGYLLDESTQRKILYVLAGSKNMWKRRIAVLGTFLFINKKDFRNSLKIADMLLDDREDLMHKAVGWMLREIGKKDENVLMDFLSTRYKIMPRTTLRYAIEKFSKERCDAYLKGMI